MMEDVEANFTNSEFVDDNINCDSDLNVENDDLYDSDRDAEVALPPVHSAAILPDQSLNHTREDAPHNIDSTHESSMTSTVTEDTGIIATWAVESEANDDSFHEDNDDENSNNNSDVPPKIAYSQSNPFNDDDVDDETPVLRRNPFYDESENQDDSISATDGVASMNPFGDDSIDSDSTPRGENAKEQLRQNRREEHKAPLNPFDDGDTEEMKRVRVREVPQQRKEVTSFVSPTVPVSQFSKIRAKPSSEKQCEVPQRTFSKEYQELITLGFDKICAGNALQKTSGDLPTARKMLMSRLFDDRILANEEVYVWKSPVMIRVGR